MENYGHLRAGDRMGLAPACVSVYYRCVMVTQNYSVRLEPALVRRLDRLAEAMTAELSGVKVTRTQALRMTVELGLAQAETKFGVAKAKPKR